MKKLSLKALALAGAALAGTWSGSAMACPSEAYLSSICTMAWTRSGNWGNGTYMPASGQLLSISQYTAVYSLLGITYGGNGTTNFNLPNLIGRVVIGAGTGGPSGSLPVGQAGGNAAITLTLGQMPLHTHTPALTATWAPGTLAANTSLSGLSATTTLTNVTGTVQGSAFTLNAAGDGTASVASSGAALGSPGGLTKVYSGSVPTVVLSNKSIGGSATVQFSGNPSTSISGSASTTLTGTPGIAVGGTLGTAGSSQPVTILPPYLALYQYIAVQGLYPTQD